MIRVLLADDHAMVRAGLHRLIDDCNDIEVGGEAEDGRQLLDLVRTVQPHVVVVDLTMPNLDGFDALARIQESYPEIPVIVLTMHEEPQYVVRCVRGGAKGYITKRAAPQQLVAAIRKVHRGGRFLTELAAEALAVHTADGNEPDSPLDGLSNREIQVLRRLALGATNREIAEAYNISIKTVDTYRLRILKKLDLRNNAELSRFAIKHKLVDL